MFKLNNKFPNFLFCIFFFFPFVIWGNSKDKTLPDTITHRFGNSVLVFKEEDYYKIRAQYKVYAEEKTNPIDWHYLHNVKTIIENILKTNGLPTELAAGIFFEFHHFRQNYMKANLPALGESRQKIYEKDDTQKTDDGKNKDKDLEWYFNNTNQFACLIKNPFLVINDFVELLKKQKRYYKSDFIILNFFFYSPKEISENCKKEYKQNEHNYFEDFCLNKKAATNLIFKYDGVVGESFHAVIIWKIINEHLKNFEPNFILEKYICEEGDTWQSIIKQKNVDKNKLYEYNNFFTNAAGNPIPMNEVKNVKLKKGTVLALPISNPKKIVVQQLNEAIDISHIPQKQDSSDYKKTKIEESLFAKENAEKMMLEQQHREKENEELNKAEKELLAKNEEQKEAQKEVNEAEKGESYDETTTENPKNNQEETTKKPSKTGNIYASSSPKYLDIGLAKQQSLKANEAKITQYHIVKYGETLWKLHQQYKVKLEDLKQWNGVGHNNKILVGQKLIVIKNEKLRGKKLSATLESYNDVRTIVPNILEKNNKKIVKLLAFKNKIAQNTSNQYIKNYKFYVKNPKNAQPKSTKRTTKK